MNQISAEIRLYPWFTVEIRCRHTPGSGNPYLASLRALRFLMLPTVDRLTCRSCRLRRIKTSEEFLRKRLLANAREGFVG
jgi:hypothetical protein